VQEIIELDETADFRTVIVNDETNKQEFNRYQFNLNWTLQELVSFLKREMKLADIDQYRLRNHLNNKLYMQEEMDTKLRMYETFKEGGFDCKLKKVVRQHLLRLQ